MDLAELSIKRPIFITCIVIVMLAVGSISIAKIGVDLFPDVNVPVVAITTEYKGAGPREVETLISKPIEEKVSTISGLKRVTSRNFEGLSQIVAEFKLETDISFAEQQVRDKVNLARPLLPKDVETPVIERFDPSNQPIVTLSLTAQASEADLFDLAEDTVKPLLEQADGVGRVEIVGARQREIHVLLDRKKLKERELSVGGVATALKQAGENVPSGKVNEASQETVFRALGEFRSISEIEKTVVSFFGNDRPVLIKDVGNVSESLEDEKSRTFVNGTKTLFLNVYRQAETNTIAVVEGVKKRLPLVERVFESQPGNPKILLVRDGGEQIKANVFDVTESILFGILLTIFVVFLFLGSLRSTIITGLALPNSLIGAFILISAFGFTINIVTLLALSLSVGLLVDDAIVVRENIFRFLEKGYSPIKAAIEGAKEVRLAVIATTFVILAVFGSVAFLQGFVGQFFREFGLTICFAMLISLFDALAIAPMLSAYFVGKRHSETADSKGWYNAFLSKFQKWQNDLDAYYEKVLRRALSRPLVSLGISFAIFAGGLVTFSFLPKTFIPPAESGEFIVNIDLPPGTNLEAMEAVALGVDKVLASDPAVTIRALTVGGLNGEPNRASFYVKLKAFKERDRSTSEVKAQLREILEKDFAKANPIVADYDPFGGGARPFLLNILGSDQQEIQAYAQKLLERLKADGRLTGLDLNFRPGKPELQFELSSENAARYGLSTKILGDELRAQVEGIVGAKYRTKGNEYDIRLRIEEKSRNLRENFQQAYVPNVNGRLIRLADVVTKEDVEGPSNIDRQNRTRYVQIAADVKPGAGLGDVMALTSQWMTTDLKPPAGVTFAYVGDSENFQEFGQAMMAAILLSILFIYLVLASLYESFITPLTIMLALPLAVCGAFYALLIGGKTVDLFSMIGVILLLGVSSKNSILLVDFANQRVAEGMDRISAMIEAGKARLRPILMTSAALIAGALPIAIGLNEASSERVSMGWAIMGGLISSTLLTLIVIPCAYLFIDRLRTLRHDRVKGQSKTRSPGPTLGLVTDADDHRNAGAGT